LLLSFVSLASSPKRIIHIKTKDDAKHKIERGKQGDTFLFENGSYLLPMNIKVPNGITIQGMPKTILVGKEKSLPFFNLADSSDVTIKNLNIKPISGQLAFAANQTDTYTTNLVLENITILGNGDKHLQSKTDYSGMAIYIKNAKKLRINNCKISHTRGGIYLWGEDLKIKRNQLKQVYFGNIVVTGKTIEISQNNVNESGKGTDLIGSEGDSITIGANSSDILIKENKLDMGYCYMLWAHGTVNNLTITRNLVKESVTGGVYIDDAQGLTITNNLFLLNAGGGIGIEEGNNILIKNNIFKDNYIYMGIVKKKISNALIIDNQFWSYRYPTEDQLLWIDKSVSSVNNEIHYLQTEEETELVAITEKGQLIHQGETIETDQYINHFVIKKTGSNPVYFLGGPFVILSDQILQPKDKGSNNSVSSQSQGFSIKAADQPNRRVLLDDEVFSYIIKIEKNTEPGDTAIVNIPTNNTNHDPFWFIIKYIGKINTARS
jgi:parallel beta-helix repeat protein